MIDLMEMIKDDKKKFKSFLPSLSKKIPEIMSSNYWLISGIPGTGKTALMDKLFVLDPALGGKDVAWVYRSMERSLVYKHAKWLAYIIWKNEGILFDVKTMLQTKSATKKFTQKDMVMLEHYYNWMKENIFKNMYLRPGRASVSNIKSTYEKAHQKLEGKKEMIIHLLDHLDKVTGKEEKYKITSDYSDMIGELRDATGGTFCDIVQVKVKNVMDVHRRKHFGAESTLSDLYMGEKVAQNTDVAISIIHPQKLGTSAYRGYDMSKFTPENSDESVFRAISVMKTNFDKEAIVPTNFVGAVGDFEELPHFSSIAEEDYERYLYPEHRNLIKQKEVELV